MQKKKNLAINIMRKKHSRIGFATAKPEPARHTRKIVLSLMYNLIVLIVLIITLSPFVTFAESFNDDENRQGISQEIGEKKSSK